MLYRRRACSGETETIMAKSSNQKLKLLYILKFLSEETDEEHMLTTQQLIQKLAACGISAERKSIYENIEDLRSFGIDIENEKSGRSSGYYIASRDFELPELKLLVDAVQASKFITKKKTDTLIHKIEGFASRYQAMKLQRQVFVTNRIKHENESIYYNVDKIHNAINANRRLEFYYFDWTAQKTKALRRGGKCYEVSPWALSWDDENYYMIGYDEESDMIKHYRVDKMEKIALKEEARAGMEKFKNFDMAVYSKKMFGMFGGREETVTINVRNDLAGVVIDRFGSEALMMPKKDGTFDVRVSVYVSPVFYSWVFAFGDGMRITAPEAVIDEFVRSAQNICERYKAIT